MRTVLCPELRLVLVAAGLLMADAEANAAGLLAAASAAAPSRPGAATKPAGAGQSEMQVKLVKTGTPVKTSGGVVKPVTEVPSVASGPAMGLEDFLKSVGERNGNFKAIASSREASLARQLQGDMELSTILTASAQSVDDKKPQFLGAFNVSGTKAQEFSVGLSKKFSTGTQAAVTASVNEATTAIQVVAPPASLSTTNALGGLGFSISQSLWKDFFGSGTGLRHEREAIVQKTESQGLDLQSRQVMIDAEAAFWDHLYLKEELRQRQESLARARRIETWVKNRAGNGIGDRADVLNAQGLVAGRELQLLGSQDEMRASEEKIRDLLELMDQEALPDLRGNLEGLRSIQALIDGEIQQTSGSGDAGAASQKQVVRLDAYLSVLEAKAKAVIAREIEEGTRPDLVLSGAYKTNSVDSAMSGAMSNVTDTSKPTTVVGIKFTYLLDGDVKDASRRTAKMEALAAEQRRGRKLLESRTSWEELQRRHSEMTNKVAAAEKTSVIQTQKAEAERDKLSKGRSITSNVILAEEDAATSQLTLAKLRAEQRKLESQGRLFIQLSENTSGAQ